MTVFYRKGLVLDLLYSLILSLPIILYYIAHFYAPEGFVGTGFVAGDMASYMANARQHFDEGSFHFFYANPFNLDNSGPHIYFQFQTLILGIIWYLTNADVGIIFMVFGFVSTFLAAYIALKLFKKLFGWNSFAHLLVFLLFLYGGGILIISGFTYNYFQDKSFIQAALDCLEFDPGGGFWMLNLGRNFVYPTEAFYHFLTLTIVYAVVSNRQKLLSLILFILAFSHPFYGIQFLLIVLSWQTLELIFLKQKKQKRQYYLINIGTLIAFAFYNLVYLASFPEHQIIIKQWSLNWSLPFISSLLAYGPLLIIFFYQIRNKQGIQGIIANPNSRFLLIYLSISLLLANHELFIKPIQPIHFAHGHIYIPLFLLVANSLIKLFKKHGKVGVQIIKLGLFTLLIFDNLSWYPAQYFNSMYSKKGARLGVSPLEMDAIKYINKHYDYSYIIASENTMIDYLATTYTDTYALLPHGHNTPFVADRKRLHSELFEYNDYKILPYHKLLVIDDTNINGVNQNFKTNPIFVEVYKNDDYILYERKLNNK